MYIIQQCWEKMLNQSQSRGNDPTLKVETVTQSPRHGEIPTFTLSNIKIYKTISQVQIVWEFQ